MSAEEFAMELRTFASDPEIDEDKIRYQERKPGDVDPEIAKLCEARWPLEVTFVTTRRIAEMEAASLDRMPVYVREMVNLTPEFLRELARMDSERLKLLTHFVEVTTKRSLDEFARSPTGHGGAKSQRSKRPGQP